MKKLKQTIIQIISGGITNYFLLFFLYLNEILRSNLLTTAGSEFFFDIIMISNLCILFLINLSSIMYFITNLLKQAYT